MNPYVCIGFPKRRTKTPTTLPMDKLTCHTEMKGKLRHRVYCCSQLTGASAIPINDFDIFLDISATDLQSTPVPWPPSQECQNNCYNMLPNQDIRILDCGHDALILQLASWWSLSLNENQNHNPSLISAKITSTREQAENRHEIRHLFTAVVACSDQFIRSHLPHSCT